METSQQMKDFEKQLKQQWQVLTLHPKSVLQVLVKEDDPSIFLFRSFTTACWRKIKGNTFVSQTVK